MRLHTQTYWLESSCTINCWPHIDNIGSTMPCLRKLVWKLYMDNNTNNITANTREIFSIFSRFFLCKEYCERKKKEWKSNEIVKEVGRCWNQKIFLLSLDVLKFPTQNKFLNHEHVGKIFIFKKSILKIIQIFFLLCFRLWDASNEKIFSFFLYHGRKCVPCEVKGMSLH